VVDPYTLSIHLKVGDVVYDSETKESGVLVRRIDLLENFSKHIQQDIPGIIAWEIMWAGSDIKDSSVRMYVYTESGLINMIREGLLQLYQNN
jgi:hypothetical protein